MSKELNNIISVVIKHTGVNRYDLMYGQLNAPRMARCFVCYIISEAFPHLRIPFLDMAEMRKDRFWASATFIENELKDNHDVITLIKRIRADLDIPLPKDRTPDYISPTKRMFGFDYTSEDEHEFQKLRDEADDFWARLTGTARRSGA